MRELYLRVAGHSLRAKQGSIEQLVANLINGLQTVALSAKRPVVYGNGYSMEPDYRLRMEATLKLLALVEPPSGSRNTGPATGARDTDEIVARETHTREVRRRTKR